MIIVERIKKEEFSYTCNICHNKSTTNVEIGSKYATQLMRLCDQCFNELLEKLEENKNAN